jgi:hypothetical protein
MAGSSHGCDEPAIDDEVGACGVAGAVAGQEEDQVGHFLRPREAAGHRAAGRFLGNSVGRTADGFGHGRGDAAIPSHSAVATGPGLIVLTRTPWGPASLDSALQKFASAALAAL